MTELTGFEDVTIRRGLSVMGSIFQGGGVRTLDDTTLLSLIFANFHVVFLIEKGPVSNKIH